MQLIFLKLSIKMAAIGPVELSVACLHSIRVHSFVFGAIGPGFYPFHLHVIFPLTNIDATIHVNVLTCFMSFVFLPHAFIDVAIGVDDASMALALVILPEAIVDGTIGINALAFAVARLCPFNATFSKYTH